MHVAIVCTVCAGQTHGGGRPSLHLGATRAAPPQSFDCLMNEKKILGRLVRTCTLTLTKGTGSADPAADERAQATGNPRSATDEH